MNSITKFHSYVLAATSLTVFSAWTSFNFLTEINPIFRVLGASIFTLGLYRLLSNLLSTVFKKSRWMRKHLLGSTYMEGTWAGFYIGISGKPRFLIERFEQEIDCLIIRGIAYKEDGSYHTSWTSYPANIDVRSGILNYMYELKGLEDSGHGITYFNLSRKSQHSPPTHLKGFSADIHNRGVRTKAFEYKLTDTNLIEDNEVLKYAMEFYNKNKNNF